MTATEERVDYQTRKKYLESFRAFNFSNGMDFTIKLGGRRWTVQKVMLTTISRFFKVLCDGPFQESSAAEVELHDDNPWDFARLLQFAYTGAFDEGAFRIFSLPLADMVKSSDFPMETDIEAERARTKFEVRSGVWAIAEKYDVPSLRYEIASSLVNCINCHRQDHPEVYNHAFLVEFPAVYELIHAALHESSAMEDLESTMVKLLVVYKLQQYDAEARTGVSILVDTVNESSSTDSTRMREFQAKIIQYMNDNGHFARKYAQSMESMMNKAFKHYKWSKSRLDDLRPTLE